jgi:hypothetical protein
VNNLSKYTAYEVFDKAAYEMFHEISMQNDGKFYVPDFSSNDSDQKTWNKIKFLPCRRKCDPLLLQNIGRQWICYDICHKYKAIILNTFSRATEITKILLQLWVMTKLTLHYFFKLTRNEYMVKYYPSLLLRSLYCDRPTASSKPSSPRRAI